MLKNHVDELEKMPDELEKMTDDDVEEEVEEEEEEEKEEDTSLRNNDVLNKYQEAARIANAVFEELVTAIEPGKTPNELCLLGDNAINEKLKGIFNKKVNGEFIPKGVAFPTCISVNECVAHNTPLSSEVQPPLQETDTVKIDLGVYIGGFVAVIADTVVVNNKQPNPETPIGGRLGDAYMATIHAADVCSKMIKPGNNNLMVTEALVKIAEAYEVKHVQGTLTHNMKK